ncbi:hypothetical protein ZWY2020_019024 [Hordeum vulgare]|nr:hypothetical protein ZWY2020_019024 [Hordeum vulgare]
MGGGGLVVRVWKEWGIQILVVASFLLQLILLVFGGLRRRSSSARLLAFLWLSYLMADNIAVYALGHMSLESRPGDDGLVAFWATFFLLHLGGQDTITAFSLEDNQLWRRHLLTLVVQASGAGYAIYRYTIPGTWTLVSATIVMFIVGFLKYGERVWALQRGNNGNFALLKVHSKTSQDRPEILKTTAKMDREELILFEAHYMFQFCMCAFINVSLERWSNDTVRSYLQTGLPLPYKLNTDMLYDLVEAELSLLYDMFYTKAQVAHSWQGYLIRAISLLGTVATDIYLCCCDDNQHQSRCLNAEEDDKLLVEAIKVLSKYMGFLVIHPSLLPGGVPSDSTINDLEELWKNRKCSTNGEFARSLLDHKSDARPYISLAGQLLGNKMNLSMLQVIFEVWVEFLCYAAYHGTGISHCIQLGRGGEFLSVIRLVIDHIELFQKHKEKSFNL